MKRFVSDFCFRGLAACGIGPIVLAIVYLVLRSCGVLTSLTVNEVCIGIFSMEALAFIAGGMNAIYKLERLPLLTAILIHGTVLYVAYLCAFLLNGWLERGGDPLIIFSAVFAVGYLVIWAIIYSLIRKNAASLNEKLKKKQESSD